MKHFALFVLLAAFSAFGGPASAQEKKVEWKRIDLIPKTPVDYTLDDGVMSKDEMELEAQDMYKLCENNAYQRRYFKCECLAGAFLQQREKLGPMVEQYDIFKTITNSKETDARCANTEEVAGRAFKACLSFTRNYARMEFNKDNEDYCTCAANKVARDYSKAPRLSGSYVEALRMNAMTLCKDPEGRKKLKAEGAREDAQAAQAKTIQSGQIAPVIPKKTN